VTDQPTGDVADLDALDLTGSDGAVWSLPHGGDLDANLVKLGAGRSVGDHRNDEVDVLLVGVGGTGVVVVDGAEHPLRPHRLVLVRKGARRHIAASPDDDLVYLSVHRARGALRIGARG
jgi:quercetin dioxygenase-like cupin family protein